MLSRDLGLGGWVLSRDLGRGADSVSGLRTRVLLMRWHSAPSVVRGEKIATPKGIVPAALHLAGGRIMRVAHIDDIGGASASDVLDAGQMTVIPGLVDTHVHVNEPGRTEWEGFATATAAAARGGVTTLLDMPLNSVPPTCDPTAFELKLMAAEDQVHVDVGFWAGAIPGNGAELPVLHDAGVFGFKCFLLPSGVDEFPPLDAEQLRHAMRTIASFDGLLIAHAEDEHRITPAPSGRDYGRFLGLRPPAAEEHAIA